MVSLRLYRHSRESFESRMNGIPAQAGIPFVSNGLWRSIIGQDKAYLQACLNIVVKLVHASSCCFK
jgi:hypothetical protein